MLIASKKFAFTLPTASKIRQSMENISISSKLKYQLLIHREKLRTHRKRKAFSLDAANRRSQDKLILNSRYPIVKIAPTQTPL